MPDSTVDQSSQQSGRNPAAQTVLVTGASGYLGGVLRAGLRERFRLRLTDRVMPSTPMTATEEFRLLELESRQALDDLMVGVDAIVHLAVAPTLEVPWETILSANIAGSYNVFESARCCGVKRIIYASSHHVMGFYRREQRIGVDEPVRPDSRYGLSKVFGEALGRLYADKYGMSVICQRIGVARTRPPHRRSLSNWLSERDYVELTRCCLSAPDVHFLVVYGVSGSSSSFYDNSSAESIGFRPQDNVERFRAMVLGQPSQPETPIGSVFQGGEYCATEFSGDLEKIR